MEGTHGDGTLPGYETLDFGYESFQYQSNYDLPYFPKVELDEPVTTPTIFKKKSQRAVSKGNLPDLVEKNDEVVSNQTTLIQTVDLDSEHSTLNNFATSTSKTTDLGAADDDIFTPKIKQVLSADNCHKKNTKLITLLPNGSSDCTCHDGFSKLGNLQCGKDWCSGCSKVGTYPKRKRKSKRKSSRKRKRSGSYLDCNRPARQDLSLELERKFCDLRAKIYPFN